MEAQFRTYLYSPILGNESIWIHSENCFEGICDSCNSLENVWKIYSYADGYVQFCLDTITKYVESGLLKPNAIGRIKSYDVSELLQKTKTQKSIPWRMKIFCEKCLEKTEFRGTSSWRSDSNHYFDGQCKSCLQSKSGGIKDLLIEGR